MSRNKRGLFVVVEGIDASGSTTQGERLAAYLREHGSKVLLTHEPSAGPAGMLIRLALARRLSGPNWIPEDTEVTEPAFTPLDVHTLALLFAADRTDHLATKIVPALERGHHVVCDRYTLSSLAYQGLHIDNDWLLSINRNALKPDLTIYLDVPAHHADLRIRHARVTREEYEELSTQEAVQMRYREVIKAGYAELGRIEVVDATRTVGTVEKIIRKFVNELLDKAPEDAAELALF